MNAGPGQMPPPLSLGPSLDQERGYFLPCPAILLATAEHSETPRLKGVKELLEEIGTGSGKALPASPISTAAEGEQPMSKQVLPSLHTLCGPFKRIEDDTLASPIIKKGRLSPTNVVLSSPVSIIGHESATPSLSKELQQSHLQSISARPRPYRRRICVNATPSASCHICRRKVAGMRAAKCGNLKRSLCRKVICELCFSDRNWDLDMACSDNGSWLCTHCTNSCPSGAHCFLYDRMNARRAKRNAVEKTSSSPKLN
mmetsp:Transcript_18271/g.38163  ORF Transcript_18271/g.38163 Transcript_18271/m.38163 type:complete len:257 (+) Transcript_18271:170-940(+)